MKCGVKLSLVNFDFKFFSGPEGWGALAVSASVAKCFNVAGFGVKLHIYSLAFRIYTGGS
jgi:hypothetical protein